MTISEIQHIIDNIHHLSTSIVSGLGTELGVKIKWQPVKFELIFDVLFSQNKRILEVVNLGGDSPTSLLNFEVYKKDVHFEGRKGEDVEPREIISADVTGDGKPDLILLIHNKVMVYPQG